MQLSGFVPHSGAMRKLSNQTKCTRARLHTQLLIYFVSHGKFCCIDIKKMHQEGCTYALDKRLSRLLFDLGRKTISFMKNCQIRIHVKIHFCASVLFKAMCSPHVGRLSGVTSQLPESED